MPIETFCPEHWQEEDDNNNNPVEYKKQYENLSRVVCCHDPVIIVQYKYEIACCFYYPL